jgi:hypothetical protein
MRRILPLADGQILPQARQEIYFFNRIGRLQFFATGSNRQEAASGQRSLLADCRLSRSAGNG